MDPKEYALCEACRGRWKKAVAAGEPKPPQLSLATTVLLVHDGTGEYEVDLCDEDADATLELAVRRWGHNALTDRYIAHPQDIH